MIAKLQLTDTVVCDGRFDVEGQVTGFGSPDWARSHGPARRNARAVQLLLDAGARCIGKVHMDEMAYRYTITLLRTYDYGLV